MDSLPTYLVRYDFRILTSTTTNSALFNGRGSQVAASFIGRVVYGKRHLCGLVGVTKRIFLPRGLNYLRRVLRFINMTSRYSLHTKYHIRPIMHFTQATMDHRRHTFTTTQVTSNTKTFLIFTRRSQRPIPRLYVIQQQVSKSTSLTRRDQIGSTLVNLAVNQSGANAISNRSSILVRRISVISSLIVKTL